MPQLEVYCTVNNCDYWGPQNHCMAEKILICSDLAAAEWPDAIDAPQAKQLAQTPAPNCMETACKTFRPKGSNQGPNLHPARQSMRP